MLVEPVELKSIADGWFLRSRADLVDGIERMAEDSICEEML